MNIIVTGASRGIGFELVKRFSTLKESRIVAVSRNLDRLNRLRDECLVTTPGSDIRVLQFDLERREGIVKELAPALQSHFDRLDILVNNAGYLIRESFAKLSIADFRKCVDVNYMGSALMIQACIPLLERSDLAHVVNISSMGGVQGSKKFPGLSAYSASKAAVQILTECLAEEYADRNIVFNCLALGAVKTEMLAEAFPGYEAPLSSGEMARFISDFAINGRQFMNGKTIPVSQSTP